MTPERKQAALVLARAVDDLAGGDLLQVLAVDRLAIGLRGLLQLGGRDPAVLPGDLPRGRTRAGLRSARRRTSSAASCRLSMVPVSSQLPAAEGDDRQRPSSRYIWLSVVISSSPRAEGSTLCALAATSPGRSHRPVTA